MVLPKTRPGSRLITQNLVYSAAYALESSEPDWSSIQDLAVLIDLFCMYDTAVALGRHVHHGGARPPALSDLLLKSDFLQIYDLPNESVLKQVTGAARNHLGTYLGNRNVGEEFDKLLQSSLSNYSAFYTLASVPDRGEEIETGSAWLKTAPQSRDILIQLLQETGLQRAANFVIRTFLYLGYHEVSGLVFVPDAVRIPLVGNVVASEKEVRDKILAALAPRSMSSPEMTQLSVNRISPLASIVFERASQRSQIIQQMVNLRDELAPMRKRIRGAEEKIFYGKGVEVNDGVKEWKLVADEVHKSFGDEPHLISLRSILSLGRAIGEVTDEPGKAKNWMGFLLGMPFEMISRVLSRRPAVELHRLRDEVPGSNRLLVSVERLFGSQIASS
jgi:hypothetical protein